MRPAAYLLTPLAIGYSGVMRARNLYYARRRAAVRRAELPVISVGNITVGGTGKTPLVIELVERLRRLGRRPAILTRGYRALPGETADEVLEYHDALPEVPVVVKRDRVAGAASSRRDHNADCVVLDDGFQHRRIARDLDIVLLDALDPWGGGWTLPAGRLREPLCGLRRADVLIVTRTNQVPDSVVRGIRAEVLRLAGAKPVLTAEVEAARLVSGAGVPPRSPAELCERPVLALSGIGNPASFVKLLESLRARIVQRECLRDHFRYGTDDVQRLLALAQRSAAEAVITTRKDWVKLAPLWPPDSGPALWRLDMRTRISDPDGLLSQALDRCLTKRTRGPTMTV